jgi:diguanylate cyclase (GGDEF)-like protein
LERAVRAARTSEAPIEDIARVSGPLSGVAAEVAGLLADYRQARAETAAAEREMRQRLSQRTEALERLVASLRVQANRDPLTGLFNRRSLEGHLRSLLDRARDSGSDLCLVAVDLDHFKSLNDTLGHAAGDELLRSVGQVIRSTVREHDAAFRHGGDEFLIVLPDSTPESGRSLADRLVYLVGALGKNFKLPRPPGASAGTVALSEMPYASPDILLAEADRRLYMAKQSRNRIGIGPDSRRAIGTIQ